MNWKRFASGDPQVVLTLLHFVVVTVSSIMWLELIPTPCISFDALHMFDADVRQMLHELYGNLHNCYFIVSSPAPIAYKWFGLCFLYPHASASYSSIWMLQYRGYVHLNRIVS